MVNLINTYLIIIKIKMCAESDDTYIKFET